MRVLALDPAIGCTGYAVVEDVAGPLRLDAGVIRPSGDGWRRCASLGLHVTKLLEDVVPNVVLVETPFAHARGGPKATRSAMTLPMYGGAVGAAVVVVDQWQVRGDIAGVPRRYELFPVDTWSRGIPGATKRDPHKTGRVNLAARIYGLKAEEFGPVSIAGNVADAALMAWWWLQQQGGG